MTPEQKAQVIGHLVMQSGPIIYAVGSAILALLAMLTRKVNQIGREQKAAKKRGKEIQENVRRIANGKSVHHEYEHEPGSEHGRPTQKLSS